MRSHKRNAFTLVEIMIVVLIIGILLAIAVPNFMKARDSAYVKSCISNLTEIAAAKEQWAMDNRKNDTDTPTTADLTPNYIKSWPICPAAGTYTINNEATNPTCTVAGHTLTNVGG